MPVWHTLELQITALLSVVLTLGTIPWILLTKKDSTSAAAWCLLVFFLPFVGFMLFVVFGWQHVQRPLRRKRKHKNLYQLTHVSSREPSSPNASELSEVGSGWTDMSRLAQRLGGFPARPNNRVEFYIEGLPAYEAILEAIQGARHHVHLEYFILQPDASGLRLLDLLTQKAAEGIEVRFLFDAMGTRHPHKQAFERFRQAGGCFSVFLPLNPFRRRIQVNMRNHRKLVVVDGQVGFTGGLNIGDEYLGRCPRFGFWRDTHLRLTGSAVHDLQRVFIEDWDFATQEDLQGARYFPSPVAAGDDSVQVVYSGPDQELNSIREIYFAAILRARERLWIATPYFVPDAGLRDALCLAGYRGVDVRLLCQHHPDKWIPFFAGRYYWADVLGAGIRVYQYTKGMMHSKVVVADGEWASVGSANLDNRSLHLNFELNCLIYSPQRVAELAAAFANDMTDSICLDPQVFARRPLGGRIVENACRLLSPIL